MLKHRNQHNWLTKKWRKWLTFEVLFHFSAYFSDRLFLINLTLDWIRYHTKMIKISKIFLLINLVSCRSQGSTDRNQDQKTEIGVPWIPDRSNFDAVPREAPSFIAPRLVFTLSFSKTQYESNPDSGQNWDIWKSGPKMSANFWY